MSDTSPAALPDVLPTAALAAPVRFCRTCGAAWDAALNHCPRCIPAATGVIAERTVIETANQDYRTAVDGVKRAITLYFSLLAVSVIFIILGLSQGKRLSTAGDFALTTAFSLVIVMFCMMSWRQLLPVLKRGAGIGWFATALGMSCGTYLIATGVCQLLREAGVPLIRYSQQFQQDGYGWNIVVLLIAVQPAIFEELAFRGVIQTSLAGVLGSTEALWVTALMFGILHLSIVSLPHLLVMGLALGLLRKRTGSLYPGMLLHFAHNFLVIAAERSGGVLPW
jgi:hypothetical protein